MANKRIDLPNGTPHQQWTVSCDKHGPFVVSSAPLSFPTDHLPVCRLCQMADEETWVGIVRPGGVPRGDTQ